MAQACSIIYHQSQFSTDWFSCLAALQRLLSHCLGLFTPQVLWGGADETLIPWLTPGAPESADTAVGSAETLALGNVKKEVLQVRWPMDDFWAHVRWFTMIYHDLPWFTMIYHDLPWFIMIYHYLSWFAYPTWWFSPANSVETTRFSGMASRVLVRQTLTIVSSVGWMHWCRWGKELSFETWKNMLSHCWHFLEAWYVSDSISSVWHNDITYVCICLCIPMISYDVTYTLYHIVKIYKVIMAQVWMYDCMSMCASILAATHCWSWLKPYSSASSCECANQQYNTMGT